MAKKKTIKDVYLTRDTYSFTIRVWPVTAGIRKWHGCVMYGAGWCEKYCARQLFKRYDSRCAERLSFEECKALYDFTPRSGAAWLIENNGRKKTQIFLAFSP